MSALQGTGKHLSPVELRAWTRFLDASRLVEEMLNRHLIDDHGMSHGEYEILVRLDGAGGSMRLSVLADQCVSPRPRLTHTLNRVEARGWIRRERSETDGRGFNAVLSASGATALAAAAVGHAALIKEHLITPFGDDTHVIAEVMSRTAAHLRDIRE